jgi:hypothetical protein
MTTLTTEETLRSFKKYAELTFEDGVRVIIPQDEVYNETNENLEQWQCGEWQYDEYTRKDCPALGVFESVTQSDRFSSLWLYGHDLVHIRLYEE